MGNARRRRIGERLFGGQVLTAAILDESQLIEGASRDSADDVIVELNNLLDRALEDPSFVHIRLIDEYGTTVFNSLQLKEVIPELERLLEFAYEYEEISVVKEVLKLAHEVADGVHHFLVFMGD